MPGEAKVISEPLGCILIIGAWNYPFLLTQQPLICALAAGNTAILKPSEFAPSTSKLIGRLISEYLPKDVAISLEGDGEFTQELLNIKFDHIFFTGGTTIGEKVMKRASKYLTPVTLELGGKNPAIILDGADIDVTARRLIWGKGLNSGQTCLAPNHLLVLEKLASPLIKSWESSCKNRGSAMNKKMLEIKRTPRRIRTTLRTTIKTFRRTVPTTIKTLRRTIATAITTTIKTLTKTISTAITKRA